MRLLHLGNATNGPPIFNLAELFAGGGGLPVLYELELKKMVLEWDATGLANAPTAAEFATRADPARVGETEALLPSLAKVDIKWGAHLGRVRSHEGFIKECRRHVWPALLLLVRRRVRPPPSDPHRDAGNVAYLAGRWVEAIAAYTRAMEGATPGSPVWLAALNNRAAAKLAAGNLNGAFVDTSLVLGFDALSVKTFLRRDAACEGLGNANSAVEDYEDALKVDPKFEQARAALARLR